MNAIHSNAAIAVKLDQVQIDVDFLLSKEAIQPDELLLIADQIEIVKQSLADLFEMVSVFMPHKTGGHCYGLDIWNNGILKVIFEIMETEALFENSISKMARYIKKSVKRIDKAKAA